VGLTAARNTTIAGNTIYGFIQQFDSVNTVVHDNRIVAPVAAINPITLSMIASTGQLASILPLPAISATDNHLDGQTSPASPSLGAQIGISVTDSANAVITGNDIRNTSFAAISTAGNITGALIARNTIANTSLGITGTLWNNWIGVKVEDNVVSSAEVLFLFLHHFGLRPANWNGRGAPGDTGVYFQSNRFSRNRLITSPNPSGYSASLPIYEFLQGSPPRPGERAPRRSEYFLQGNVFTGNDFSKVRQAPFFNGPILPGMIVDGGGNTCLQPAFPYPLVCQ
jgi:hypothetical protein